MKEKKMKRFFVGCFLYFLFMGLIACQKSVSLEVESDNLTIGINETITLTYKIINDRNNKGVIFKSENEQIANVTETGEITGVAFGIVNITIEAVADADVKKIIKVTVIKPEPESLTIETITDLILGQEIQLAATILPIEANQAILWSSSDSEVISVSSSGIIKGLKSGKAKITAKSSVKDELIKSLEIDVNLPLPETIIINGSKSVTINEEIILKAVASPDLASQGVTWVSSNTDIATISESGVVKGIKVGKVTILAISKIKSDIMASIEINVVLPEPESISINGAKDILINENITLEAIINPNLADQSVIWSSNFPEIASVSPSGIVTGLKAGKVQITAKSEVKNTVSKTIEINITLPMPESITI